MKTFPPLVALLLFACSAENPVDQVADYAGAVQTCEQLTLSGGCYCQYVEFHHEDAWPCGGGPALLPTCHPRSFGCPDTQVYDCDNGGIFTLRVNQSLIVYEYGSCNDVHEVTLK